MSERPDYSAIQQVMERLHLPSFLDEPTTEGVCNPTRSHWVATLAGILASVWPCSLAKQHQLVRSLHRLCEALGIPERGEPHQLPIEVVLETDRGFYSELLAAAAVAGPGGEGEPAIPLEVWSAYLTDLIAVAYPDLTGEERVLADMTFLTLLRRLGADRTPPSYHPVRLTLRNVQDLGSA